MNSGQDIQQSISQAKLTAYDSTKRVWELHTDNLIRHRQNKNLLLYPVHIEMFNDTGLITTTVISDSGSTSAEMDSFYIWGNVHITNYDGTTVDSKSLGWSQKSRRLTSKDRVIITTGDGEKMSGVGVDASEDFTEWNFLDSVTGEFNDIDMGIDEDEK